MVGVSVVVVGRVGAVVATCAAVLKHIPFACTVLSIAAFEQLEKSPPLVPVDTLGNIMKGLPGGTHVTSPLTSSCWAPVRCHTR